MNSWYSEFNKKQKPYAGFSGMGGGAMGLSNNMGGGSSLADLPFSATGGSKSGPSGGYYYHAFEEGSSTFRTALCGLIVCSATTIKTLELRSFCK